MTKKITDKEFNETLNSVTNYLSWETDIRRIENVIRLWGHFQEECNKPALTSNYEGMKEILLTVLERNAN